MNVLLLYVLLPILIYLIGAWGMCYIVSKKTRNGEDIFYCTVLWPLVAVLYFPVKFMIWAFSFAINKATDKSKWISKR